MRRNWRLLSNRQGDRQQQRCQGPCFKTDLLALVPNLAERGSLARSVDQAVNSKLKSWTRGTRYARGIVKWSLLSRTTISPNGVPNACAANSIPLSSTTSRSSTWTNILTQSARTLPPPATRGAHPVRARRFGSYLSREHEAMRTDVQSECFRVLRSGQSVSNQFDRDQRKN